LDRINARRTELFSQIGDLFLLAQRNASRLLVLPVFTPEFRRSLRPLKSADPARVIPVVLVRDLHRHHVVFAIQHAQPGLQHGRNRPSEALPHLAGSTLWRSDKIRHDTVIARCAVTRA